MLPTTCVIVYIILSQQKCTWSVHLHKMSTYMYMHLRQENSLSPYGGHLIQALLYIEALLYWCIRVMSIGTRAVRAPICASQHRTAAAAWFSHRPPSLVTAEVSYWGWFTPVAAQCSILKGLHSISSCFIHWLSSSFESVLRAFCLFWRIK